MTARLFKQSDIKPCACCGRGLMHAGLPLFYRISIERLGLDAHAIRRQHGLELMMGGVAPLAAVMGPNEDMARLLDGPRTILICETCTHEHPVLMQVLLPQADEQSSDPLAPPTPTLPAASGGREHAS